MRIDIIGKGEIQRLITKHTAPRFEHLYSSINRLQKKIDKLTEENKCLTIALEEQWKK